MTVDLIIQLISANSQSRTVVHAETPVLSAGILDSYHFAAFLEALRSRFGVIIDLKDIGVDNFDTPAQIVAFLRQRT